MAKNKALNDIADKLERDISNEVGNQHEDELDIISAAFNGSLNKALREFNSSTFDDDGFVKKMRNMDIEGDKDKEMMKHVLNNLRSDYVGVESLNQSELLVRRDISNICIQMPEMRDVINVIRDGIIECNVATGQVSRDLIFENNEDENTGPLAFVKDIEKTHNLLSAIKNFIVPSTLEHGEKYVHVVPYAKLFAELEAVKSSKNKSSNLPTEFKESIPNEISSEFKESFNLHNDTNVKLLMESIATVTKTDVADTYKIDASTSAESTKNSESINKENISSILDNISVYNGSSELFAEMGVDGFEKFIMQEYALNHKKKKDDKTNHFMEAIAYNGINNSNNIFNNVDQDCIDFSTFKEIKGCYVKYLDGLKMAPIRMDRKIVGYFYATTTSNEQMNVGNPNGMIDLSYQNYTRDKNLIDTLSSIIISSFDKKMLEKNVKLKSEIAEILMAHKFSEGRLSFVYIPENEIIRFVINEDENGRGHSVIEPSIFPARNYLMLSMYNLLYTLNNTTTRIYYMKASGLRKDYAAQVQRKMRKFQSRRITVDDIYSYSGVLNKVGGMGQMVLPAGRGDYKAFDVDTIEAVDNPIDLEFLESQRKLAISGTGVPHLMMINAIDEADFAKSLEMANARFLSTVSSYKIDFNEGLTKLYQKLLKYSTDLDDNIIRSFRFKFNQAKQQELVITSDMIQNFNSMVELVESLYYTKSELEDEQGNSTPIRMILRRELAKEYLPQLDFTRIEEVIKKVNIQSRDDELQNKVNNVKIDENDLDEVENK